MMTSPRRTFSAGEGSSRPGHLAALALFGVVGLAVMLADRHQQSDESSYVQLAHHLFSGYYTTKAKPDLWFGPGLPALLWPLTAIGAPLEVLRLLGPLALLCAIVLFYELLRLYVSPRAALLGGIALGAYLPLYVLLPSLHSDVVGLFLVVAFMYAIACYSNEQASRFLVLAALALGYLALTRVVFGWIVALSGGLWLLIAGLRRSSFAIRLFAVHVTALVLCIPWLAYTYSVNHHVFYWSTSGGLSLYWMASPVAGDLGDWHNSRQVFSDPNLRPHRAEFAKLQRLDESEADDEVSRDARRLIEHHPRSYVKNVAANVSRLWFNTPYSYTPQKISTLFYIVPNALLLAGLILSIALFVTRRGLPVPGLSVFAVLFVVGFVVQALLAGYSRMLVPLVPIILWAAVVSVARYVRLAPAR